MRSVLQRIDGRQYPAYRDLRGSWELGELALHVDRVQGDPYAAPSRIRVTVPTGIDTPTTRDAREAAEDWLLRRFAANLGGTRRGSGKSGQIGVYRPGPEVIERSALRLHRDGTAEVRFSVGLPARGRRILGREAAALLLEDVPRAAAQLRVGEDPELAAHIASVVRQRSLRQQLAPHGLVAFVENGSVLPRRSGVSQAPLADAIPFVSPPSLEVTLPSSEGPVVGMGIPTGVTVITGGGFHGKSTVLLAIQRGHLDHIPGDGREGVVALADTVKVRAEDGRAVTGVDISAFLRDLPGNRSTRPFDTEDASGSTSQAAAIHEALESGARTLLLDEDTSATNLLVRDERMRQLIPDSCEPIIPFVQRVRQLAVSTILVIGGVSDYLAVADRVIAMTNFLPTDVTARARELAPELPEAPGPFVLPAPRTPLSDGLRPDKVRARDTRGVRLGHEDISLLAVEQILDRDHAATLGHALHLVGELADGRRTLPQILDAIDTILDDEGVEALSPYDPPDGDQVRPRRHEIAAALNRFRGLRLMTNGNTP